MVINKVHLATRNKITRSGVAAREFLQPGDFGPFLLILKATVNPTKKEGGRMNQNEFSLEELKRDTDRESSNNASSALLECAFQCMTAKEKSSGAPKSERVLDFGSNNSKMSDSSALNQDPLSDKRLSDSIRQDQKEVQLPKAIEKPSVSDVASRITDDKEPGKQAFDYVQSLLKAGKGEQAQEYLKEINEKLSANGSKLKLELKSFFETQTTYPEAYANVTRKYLVLTDTSKDPGEDRFGLSRHQPSGDDVEGSWQISETHASGDKRGFGDRHESRTEYPSYMSRLRHIRSELPRLDEGGVHILPYPYPRPRPHDLRR